MDKNQREVRLRQEDADLNRGLLWVVGAVLLECLLMVVNRWYINFYPAEIGVAEAILNVMRVLRVGGGIVGILALVWSALCFRKGSKAGWPAVVGLALLALAVCAHVTLSYEKNGVRMLFMLVPAWAALALVYYLYQPECFLAVTAGGFGAMGLWFVRFGGMTVDVALCLVGAVLVALVTLGLKKSDGALMQAGGKKVQWAPQGISYALVLASCVLGVLVVIAAAALGSNVAYYLMFAMVAWLFALVVYYTVKMM